MSNLSDEEIISIRKSAPTGDPSVQWSATLGFARAIESAVREKGGEPTVEDFCGVDQECRACETRSGTQYRICKWACPKCGRACSMLEIDDEWCHGDSLCISHLDGKREISCGSCWLGASAALSEPTGWVHTTPEYSEYVQERLDPASFDPSEQSEAWKNERRRECWSASVQPPTEAEQVTAVHAVMTCPFCIRSIHFRLKPYPALRDEAAQSSAPSSGGPDQGGA